MGKIKEALIDSMKTYLATTTLVVRQSCPQRSLNKVLDNMTVQLEGLTDDFGIGYNFLTASFSSENVSGKPHQKQVSLKIQFSVDCDRDSKHLQKAISEVSHAISVQWEVLPDDLRQPVFSNNYSLKEIEF